MTLKIGGLCPLLQVFDMPTSIAFYRDVLGFEVVSPVPDSGDCDWVLLRLHESEFTDPDGYELCFQWPVDTQHAAVDDESTQRR